MPSDAGWRIQFEDATELEADSVVLTAPIPQALALLAAGRAVLPGGDARALQAIRYEPCLAVLAALDGASGLEGPGAVDPSTGPIDWMADNGLKGVSATPAVTIHGAWRGAPARARGRRSPRRLSPRTSRPAPNERSRIVRPR